MLNKINRVLKLAYVISKPVFGTYEDLDEILKITFEMYEDFKKALTESLIDM